MIVVDTRVVVIVRGGSSEELGTGELLAEEVSTKEDAS